jgi:hypothetical protein
MMAMLRIEGRLLFMGCVSACFVARGSLTC